jgi:serine/threonine protein phosphatase PrpC
LLIRTARGITLQVAELSDPGRDPEKQINEDSCGSAETPCGFLALVCDGMGGHSHGQLASSTAVQTILREVSLGTADVSPRDALRAAIARAARAVYELGGSDPSQTRPGSTCVSVLVHEYGADVAHVGDSRAYLLRHDSIERLTRDHSMVQEMVDAGLLRADEAARHPEANRITRALGTRPDVEAEVRPDAVPLGAGDALLLCSDGLTDLVEERELLSITRSALPSGVAVVCQRLVELANERGGHDNTSVIVLWLAEVPVLSEPRKTLPDANAPMLARPAGAAPTVVEGALAPTRTVISERGFRLPPQDSGRGLALPPRARRPYLVFVGAGLALLILVSIAVWWIMHDVTQAEVAEPPEALPLPTAPTSTRLLPEDEPEVHPPMPLPAIDASADAPSRGERRRRRRRPPED